MSQSFGGAYWVWKPYLILKTLQEIPENAVLIYSDSANIINGPVTKLVSFLKTHDIVLYEYDANVFGKLERIAKREALIKTKCDTPVCRQAPHVWAGFIVLKNTPRTRTFVQKWLQYCEEPDLVMDQYSSKIQYPDFSHHQHDEALLCISAAQQHTGIKILPYYEYDFLKMRKRKPGKEYVSAYEWTGRNIRGIDKQILNSPFMQKLRQIILEKN